MSFTFDNNKKDKNSPMGRSRVFRRDVRHHVRRAPSHWLTSPRERFMSRWRFNNKSFARWNTLGFSMAGFHEDPSCLRNIVPSTMRQGYLRYSSTMKIARPMNSCCSVDMIHARWIQNRIRNRTSRCIRPLTCSESMA